MYKIFGKKKQKEEELRSLITNFAVVSGFIENAKLIKEDTSAFGMSISYILGAAYSYAELLGFSPYEAINNAFKVFCVSIDANPKEMNIPFHNINNAIVHDESVAFTAKLGGFISAKFSMEDYEFISLFRFLVNWDWENVRDTLILMQDKYNVSFENEIKDPEMKFLWFGV